MKSYDLCVVGGGVIGATFALALAKKTPLRVALIERKLRSVDSTLLPSPHLRALSPVSCQIFKNVGIGEALIAAGASPYTDMKVWVQERAPLHFSGAALGVPALGYIIEEEVLRNAVLNECRGHSQIHFYCPANLSTLEENETECIIHLHDQDAISAKLIVGADGVQSWVRAQVGLSLQQSSYEQTAIISRVKTEQAHQETAWQRFMPNEVVAFLPLKDRHDGSIVWSVAPAKAATLMVLTDQEFGTTLAQALGSCLGHSMVCSARQAIPLKKQHVRHYITRRAVLLGDAAHTLHPLAGQGINLGLLDAVTLVEVIQEALAKNQPFHQRAVLRRYERWRKSDNALMLSGVGAIKRLLCHSASQFMPLEWLNYLPIIKKCFASYAMGHRVELPSLAKGGDRGNADVR